MSKHIDGTICPPGTHPIAKLGCSGCKFNYEVSCEDTRPYCRASVREDGCSIILAEGAKPRLVLLRKVEGGYADIEPPEWAKSIRGRFPSGRTSNWSNFTGKLPSAVGAFAYEFSSKSAEELNRE